MARRPTNRERWIAEGLKVIATFFRSPHIPLGYKIALPLVVLAVILLVAWWNRRPLPTTPAPPQDGYLFCFWNVENLFDDQDDRRSKVDEEYDQWFAQDVPSRQAKLRQLSDFLIELNPGRGPDILAICEVESIRAADLLRDSLNARLAPGVPTYSNLLMHEVKSGRHIAPALLTRLPVIADRTRLLNARLRVLETHLKADGQELVVLVSHWTARVTDDTGDRREKYADLLYGRYKAIWMENPAVDLLVCGDFNDPPDAPSVVEHLGAVGDKQAVLSRRGDPLLLNLFAGWHGRPPGTLYFQSQWSLFDQIAVSPGLLDGRGWSCQPETAQIVQTPTRPGRRGPWRFGGANDKGPRGYSDHLPVTVRLKVQPPGFGQ